MFRYNMDDVVANSFRDFHARGLDYICLERSPERTLKLYFLDGDVSKVPEVVNPHDHRYDFTTTVLAGAMVNHTFTRVRAGAREGSPYDAFDYRTPLNGGDGFTYRGVEWLARGQSIMLPEGNRLRSPAASLHTIQMLADQTVLMLEQGPDVVDLDAPTSTWVGGGRPQPDLSGLYSRMTPDHVRARLRSLEELTGNKFVEAT